MARVRAGQQRQGGGGESFEPQVRHTSGKGKKGKGMSEKQRRKVQYEKDKREGKSKPKSFVPEERWMSTCHCNDNGTCTFCVQKRRDVERGIVRRPEPRRTESSRPEADYYDSVLAFLRTIRR